jgi:predicted DNA-binding transcriptional regulator AlpA
VNFPEDPPVVAFAEIAQMLALSEATVRQLMRGEDWPPPVASLSVGRIWDTASIRSWCEAHGRQSHAVSRNSR